MSGDEPATSQSLDPAPMTRIRIGHGLSWKTILFVGFAIAWNYFTWSKVLPSALESGRFWLVLFIGFAAFGLFLAVLGTLVLNCFLRYRRCHVQLATGSGVIGGHLRGEVVLAGLRSLPNNTKITLRCIEEISHGDSTTSKDLWSHSVELPVALPGFGQGEAYVPFAFQIPYSCQATDQYRGRKIRWKLECRGLAWPRTLPLEFDMPVRFTTESDPQIGEAPERIAAEQAVIDCQESPEPAKMAATRDPSGSLTLTVHCYPGWALPAFTLLFALGFGAVGVYLLTGFAAHPAWIDLGKLVGSVPCCGFALLLLWFLMGCLGRYEVQVFRDQIIRHRRLGPITRLRTIPITDATNITYKQCASVSNRKWFSVQGKGGPLRRITLAAMLPSDLAARWFIHQVEVELERFK